MQVQNDMKSTNKYLTQKDAAKFLGINELTFLSLSQKNELPFVISGASKLFNIDDLKELKGGTEVDVINKIIVVAAAKGGVAKTTTTKHIAHILADNGKSVLCVDCDPQHYLTSFFTANLNSTEKQRVHSLNLLRAIKEEKLIQKIQTYKNNISYITGTRKLENYESELQSIIGNEIKVKETISQALPKYDYIIVDTSPSQAKITQSALLAAHTLVIPIVPDVDSYESVKDMMGTVTNIKNSGFKKEFKLQKIFILPCRWQTGILNSKLSKQLLSDVKAALSKIDMGNITVEILDPIQEYKNIAEEHYSGILVQNTKSYNNYYKSIQGIFGI